MTTRQWSELSAAALVACIAALRESSDAARRQTANYAEGILAQKPKEGR